MATYDINDPCVLAAAYLWDTRSDVLGRVAAGFIPDSQRKPAQVYLWQTEIPAVRKFGISTNAADRRKSARGLQRKRYVELLSYRQLQERWQAVILEACVSEASDRYDTKVLLPEGWRPVCDQLSFSTEFTLMEAPEFERLMDEWIPELQAAESAFAFAMEHCPKGLTRFTDMVDKLRSGQFVTALDHRWNDGDRVEILDNTNGHWTDKPSRAYTLIPVEEAVAFAKGRR